MVERLRDPRRREAIGRHTSDEREELGETQHVGCVRQRSEPAFLVSERLHREVAEGEPCSAARRNEAALFYLKPPARHGIDRSCTGADFLPVALVLSIAVGNPPDTAVRRTFENSAHRRLRLSSRTLFPGRAAELLGEGNGAIGNLLHRKRALEARLEFSPDGFHAPLIGATRSYAEARCRFAFGMAALSAETPMFLMGEEIGAAKYFRTTDFSSNKEDLIGERTGDGRFMFRFYQDLIRFVTATPAAQSRAIDVIYRHNDNRVIAFTRSAVNQKLLILASLNDMPFTGGYVISTDSWRLPSGGWREIFNSDAATYGGENVGNGGATLQVSGGQINAIIPAHGFVVLRNAS
jgi:hypothetical protein